MNELAAADGPFDLIWCEGALYNMGFSHGLTVCRDLLRTGGLMATSELTWLHPDVPDDCRNFFAETYPPMTDTAGNRDAIERSGLDDLGHFTLAAEAWWDKYYTPIADRLQSLRKKHASDPDWGEILDMIAREIEICRKYGHSYGYVFFLMQRP